MHLIAVRLPKELLSQVEKLSKELERSKSFIIRKAIQSYIRDYIDYQIALDRLKDKDDEIISLDELRKST